MGYTPQLAVSVWMGGTSGRVPLTFGGGATGGKYPAATWGRLMSAWLGNKPIVDFQEPEDPRPGGKCLRMPGESSCHGSSGSSGTRRRRPRTGGSGGGGGGGTTPTTETPTTSGDGNVTPGSTVA